MRCRFLLGQRRQLRLVVGIVVVLSSAVPMRPCCWPVAAFLVMVMCAVPQVIYHCYNSILSVDVE